MPSKRLKLPVHKYASVSTGHITRRDAELLDLADWSKDADPSIPLIAKYDEGYFLYTLSEWADETQWKEDLVKAGLSEAFVELWLQASKAGCEILRLDADGETIDDLPLFEW